jgi:hypothetical protein
MEGKRFPLIRVNAHVAAGGRAHQVSALSEIKAGSPCSSYLFAVAAHRCG